MGFLFGFPALFPNKCGVAEEEIGEVMTGPSRVSVRSALLLAVFCVVPHVRGQVIEMREVNGERIFCTISGLTSFESPCGLDGNYAYIFVGSVLSMTEVSKTEMRLQLTPTELLLGTPADELAIITNQGNCLPEIRLGDRWLFYLSEDKKSHEFVLAYGSPSGPIAEELGEAENRTHIDFQVPEPQAEKQ
jgi:hypothetical protein